MLTGKDVYEAFKRYGVTLNMDDASVYGAVADMINASSIMPLQGSVEALQAQNDKLAADIKTVREWDRKIFDKQNELIDSLKALVRGYHAEIAVILATGVNPGDCRLQELQERTEALLAPKEQ